MRKVIGPVAMAAVCLSGCAAITRDLRHPGGYPGRMLDKRTFDASESKQIQLLRFSIILAMAARMASETANDAKDADAVAEYLASTADEINYAAANVYPVTIAGSPDQRIAPCRVRDIPPLPKPDASLSAQLNTAVADAKRAAADAQRAAATAHDAADSVRSMLKDATPPAVAAAAASGATDRQCHGYYVNFEADVPLIEFRMMRLLFATLPRDHIRKFAEDIQKGNFMGSAWNAVKIVFVGVKGLHTASGTYRSGQEVFVANFKQCSGRGTFANSEAGFNSGYDESQWTVKSAVACLGLSPDDLLAPDPDEIAVNELPRRISERSFDAVMEIARTSCVRLPIGTADNSTDELAKARERRAGLCAKLQWRPQARLDRIELK